LVGVDPTRLVTPPLFLLDPLPDGDTVRLDGEEGRHAATVKRIGIAETVLVGDGRGRVLEATVVTVRPAGLQLAVSARRFEPAADPRLVVVQALPKGDRAELAVELLTELGVDEIVPWRAARCVTVWSGDRGDRAVSRWRRTAREAAKQSRRAWLPAVCDPLDTAAVAARLAGASGAVVLHESAAARFADITLPTTGELVLVVGPEGGITDAELDQFAVATPVRLGDQVLRTSTAGAAALAVVAHRFGRWN
jgi:16S rRNA (uracil1498-N3)-methyltransferase